MIYRKKHFALLGALIVSAGILGAVVFTSRTNILDNSDVKTDNVQNILPDSDEQKYLSESKTKPQDKAPDAEKNNTPQIIQYVSDLKEAIIGIYGTKQLDNPADNIFTVHLDEAVDYDDNVWLRYELEGVNDYTNVPHSINDRLATGGYLIKKSGQSGLQREQVNPRWLKKGKNLIQFSLPEDADFGYKVSNLSIEVEKHGNTSPLIVNSSSVSYDNKVYLHGYLQRDDVSNALFYVDGKQINHKNGEFEIVASLNNNRKVEVVAVLADGRKLNKELNFRQGTNLDISYPITNDIRYASQTFKKGVPQDLRLETALLKVDSSALLVASKNISITTLRHIDIPSLDMGMSNTTAGHKGYRFLPHGEHFADGATVSIKYDRTKIPNGFTEDDIRTYYFDLDTKHWVALERDSIDKQNQLIVSRTKHFTDMINGVIQTPESPETQGYAPTQMSDIKAADPTAKVQLITPPSANNRGTAGLSYSFEMPPARNGMSPGLGIQYNSDGGSGWLGEGWDLNVPSITVDTRWGVPRYNENVETETYNFSGSMLMTLDDQGNTSVAHRGDRISRKADRQFYPRNEGSFSKIIRKGTSPGNYTWEIVDKSGTKYYYNTPLKGSITTIDGQVKEVIAEWKLTRVEELHGDWIEYVYEVVDEPVKGGLTSKAIYLKEVHAGNKGDSPHTEVKLIRGQKKQKLLNNAKYGFLTSQNDLLSSIEVAFAGQKLREYAFNYRSGEFFTDLLERIVHKDENGKEFNSHKLDYHNEVNGGEFFKEGETWNTHNDGVSADFINPLSRIQETGDFSDKATALGGSKSISRSGSIYVGVGPLGDNSSKSLTGGLSFNYSYLEGKGLSTLIDINGDGIPDKVYKQPLGLYCRPGDADGKFGEPIKIKGADQFSTYYTNSTSFGGKIDASIGGFTAMAGKDWQTSKTKVSRYFADINGDGLVDLVVGNKVYFNHIEKDQQGNLVPTFTLSSGDTPSPINGGGVIDDSDTEVDMEEQKNLIKNNPLQDVVRMWVAPYDGTVNVSGQIKLLIPQDDFDEEAYAKSDGIRAAIQLRGNEIKSLSISKGDATSRDMAVSGLTVKSGDRIYFRVQSGIDDSANADFDKVEWSPIVSYSTPISADANEYNQSYLSSSTVISDAGIVVVPVRDTYTVKSTFEKPLTSDSITLRVLLGDNKVVYEKNFAGEEVFNGEINFSVDNGSKEDQFQFIMEATTQVAWEKITWKPSVYYLTKIEDGLNQIDYEQSVSASVKLLSIYGQAVNFGGFHTIQNGGTANVLTSLFLKGGITSEDRAKISGTFKLVMKSQTKVLHQKNMTINNGVITDGAQVETEIGAGKVWVELYSPYTDTEILNNILKVETTIKDAKGIQTQAPAMVYHRWEDRGFGALHRQWGQFSYNSMEGRAQKPIMESLLTLPQDKEEADPMKMVFVPMHLDLEKDYYQGNDTEVYIKGAVMSPSRLGLKDVVLENPLTGLGNTEVAEGNCLKGSGAIGIRQETKSKSTAIMKGLGIGGALPNGLSVSGNGSLSKSEGESQLLLSFRDMNGDGYPDIISKKKVQMTNTKGGFDGEVIEHSGSHKSKSSSLSFSIGGNPVHTLSAETEGTKTTGKSNSAGNSVQKSISGSINIGRGDSEEDVVETFMDINGDGLPDKVLNNKQVQINLGYSFTEPIDWNLERIEEAEGETFDVSISGGMNSKDLGSDKNSSSWSAGLGLASVKTSGDFNLMDVNGDGLIDKVWISWAADSGTVIYQPKAMVALNKGNSFANPIEWKGLTGVESTSVSESAKGAFTVGFSFWLVRVVINPGIALSKSMNRTLREMRDVDGDGFLDIVSSDKESKLQVRRSAIGKTNKLKTVYNPLGGSFTVDYDRSKATYDHPGGKWVMKSVEINDGIHDDGANMKTVFDYQEGKQDRHEREFLGFGKIITKSIDTEAEEADKVYRQTIQEYDVNSVYTAGNQLRSVVEDAQGNKFTESVNEYYSYKVKPSADNYKFVVDNNICTDRAIAFTPMKYTKSVVYEGQSTGLVANESYYEYYLDGNFGELKNYKYSDKGTLGSSGTGSYNYQTQVDYTHNKAKHILGLPVGVRVIGEDGKLYRRTKAVYDLNYANHLTKVSQVLNDNGDEAVIDIVYDRSGNITKKTLPANSKGQRMWYKYLYDRDYNMYVERVEDAFGYRSEMEDYDYRYGIPLTTRDMNGYTLETTLDNLGRVSTITGPNEQVQGLPYTIKFEYHPWAKTGDKGIESPAYAITKHYDPQNPTDDLETVTLVDGMARPIQVKKDGVITETTNGSNPVDKQVMIVSGRAKYDPFGRVKEAFYPVSEALGTKTVFNPVFDNVTPTRTQYDVMDRAVLTTLPDGTSTQAQYTKDNAARHLVTTMTDALGGKQSTFTNGSGLTTKTEQYSGPDGTITTSFYYDPINQLLTVVDNGGNETLSAYDMAGRRTEMTHPDAGTVRMKYDNASNLLSRQTANLAKDDKYITYDYNFNRLEKIVYPDHPENNVTYTYGNKNARHNRVGRLMLQEDATGAQEFYYGRLGELTEVRRTIVIPNQAIATYVTKWKYDSWNRLEEMIYPDQEKISYAYNAGGLLESVKGAKAYSYNYVNKIGYDKFEQRIYMKYCNGAETAYTYDPERRRLDNLLVVSGQKERKTIMDNNYVYDAVSNVLSVTNTAPLPTTGMGGQMTHTYNYDGLYRLQSATGTYTGASGKTASYSLDMAYDNLHNIVSKKQHIQQSGIMFDGILKAGYELAYNYDAKKPHQISTLGDDSYRTEAKDAKDNTIKDHKYQYDDNGNLVYVNTHRQKKDGEFEDRTNERKLLWDEENRLEAIDDNGYISNYWYDAAGERIVKTSGDNEGVYVNHIFSGGRTQTANFTAYVNPYMVITKGGRYTKHIYVGMQRIVSKLGDMESYGADPRRIEYAGSGVEGANVDYKDKYVTSQKTIKDRYEKFEVPYRGKDNDDYVNGGGFCCDDSPQTRGGNIGNGNDNPEKYQYYYHADHLGSSSIITNLDGEVAQHIEYVPFGEVFIEERNNTWNTPYLFNTKELDEETGLYYYGARYYDPRVSLFYGVDPLTEETMTPYQYCYQNPVKFVDPTGMKGDWHEDGKGNLVADKGDSAGSLAKHLNVSQQSAEKILTDQGYQMYEKGGKRYTQINAGSKVRMNTSSTSISKPQSKQSDLRQSSTGTNARSGRRLSSTTRTSTTEIALLPDNIFLSVAGHSSTTFGNSGVFTTDSKMTNGKPSQDHQLNILNIFKSNTEISSDAITFGIGLSLFDLNDLNLSVKFTSDILNSEFSMGISENINRDNTSTGTSIGVKPVSLLLLYEAVRTGNPSIIMRSRPIPSY